MRDADKAGAVEVARALVELGFELVGTRGTSRMLNELGVVGLMNTQFALQGDDLYILEVNPRASRTVPFVSKTIGVPLAKVAARCMAGRTLAEQGVTRERRPRYFAVKEAVFPFAKFPGVDPLLGPEMKSTGEVMGVGASFGEAFAKATLGAGSVLPRGGKALLSMRDADKAGAVEVARALVELGFELVGTRGTSRMLNELGVHVVDLIKNDEISLIINTTEGKPAVSDSFAIRREALNHKVAYSTTLAGARATVMALRCLDDVDINRLQDLHREMVT
jgi:carbamoyl-phosphate synthase large subunit